MPGFHFLFQSKLCLIRTARNRDLGKEQGQGTIVSIPVPVTCSAYESLEGSSGAATTGGTWCNELDDEQKCHQWTFN